MRTFTKYTHQFQEMKHDTVNQAADCILFVVFLALSFSIGSLIVCLVNTYIG